MRRFTPVIVFACVLVGSAFVSEVQGQSQLWHRLLGRSASESGGSS